MAIKTLEFRKKFEGEKKEAIEAFSGNLYYEGLKIDFYFVGTPEVNQPFVVPYEMICQVKIDVVGKEPDYRKFKLNLQIKFKNDDKFYLNELELPKVIS